MPHKFLLLWLKSVWSTCDSVMLHTGFCSCQPGTAEILSRVTRQINITASTTGSAGTIWRLCGSLGGLCTSRWVCRSVTQSRGERPRQERTVALVLLWHAHSEVILSDRSSLEKHRSTTIIVKWELELKFQWPSQLWLNEDALNVPTARREEPEKLLKWQPQPETWTDFKRIFQRHWQIEIRSIQIKVRIAVMCHHFSCKNEA